MCFARYMGASKGFAQVLVLVLLLAGIASGAYLVQNKTFFAPKAYTPTPISGPMATPTPKPGPFVCTACAADINKNGRVDAPDYARLAVCWGAKAAGKRFGQSCAPADINGNGRVDGPDYSCLRSKYAQKCVIPIPTPVLSPFPKPSIYPTSVVITPIPIPTSIIVTPTPTPNIKEGAYKLNLSNNQTTVNCRVGDLNCQYTGVVIASNKTDKPLYQTTAWADDPFNILRYTDFNGNSTNGKSTSNKVVQPGQEAINTLLTVKAPNVSKAGSWIARWYIDGKTCNLNTNPPDCTFYGGSSVTIKISVVESSITSTPKPTSVVITPTPTPAISNAKRVFVTSTTYNGNLGGLSGADAKCQARANAVNLGGTWKAWITDYSNVDAASRLNHSTVPYQLLNGTVIANNWADLTDQTLMKPIEITEYGTVVDRPNPYNSSFWDVWTNTWTSGHIWDSATTCDNWTSSSETKFGIGGSSYQSDYGWTIVANSNHKCNTLARLYCFEQ